MKIYQLESEEDKTHFSDLSIEYLTWLFDELESRSGIRIIEDVVGYIESNIQSIEKWMPPQGHLLLCDIDGEIAGMAGLQHLTDSVCEIKRMYVRPKFRRRGISRKMLDMLTISAKEKNYHAIRLDSCTFLKEAHALYRSFGFTEIPPYNDAEIPEELITHFLFFEYSLT